MARRESNLALFRRVEKLAAREINVKFDLAVPGVYDDTGEEIFPPRRVAVVVQDGFVRSNLLDQGPIPLVLLMAKDQPWRRLGEYKGKLGVALAYQDEGTGIVDLLGPYHEAVDTKRQDEEYAMYIGAALRSAYEAGAVEPVPEKELAEDVALQFYGDTDAANELPDEAKLIEAFSDYWKHDGKDVELAAFRLRNLMIAGYAYGSDGAEDVLGAVDGSIGGHGIERIQAEDPDDDYTGLYVNMGDTYATTIIYDFETFGYILTSLGEYVESRGEIRQQERGRHRARRNAR